MQPSRRTVPPGAATSVSQQAQHAQRTLAAGGGASLFLALPGVSALAMPLRRWKMVSSRYLQEESRKRKADKSLAVLMLLIFRR